MESALYMGVEIIVYILFFVLITVRLAERKLFRRTIIDIPVIILLAIALVSFIKNESEVIASAHNLRTLFRYIVLFYILSNLKLDKNAIEKIFRMIIVLGVIQALIAIVQFLGGEGIKAYFYAKEVDLELAGQALNIRDPALDRVGAGIGTLGQPSILAMFLLIASAVTSSMLFSENRRDIRETLLLFLSLLVILAGVLTTYKRAAILIAFSIPVMAMLFSRRKSAYLPLGIVLSLTAVFVISVYGLLDEGGVVTGREAREHHVAITELLNNLFTEEYWSKSSSTSRLWFLRESLVTIFGSVNMLGYGPDPEHAIQLFVADRRGLGRLLDYYAYKDVYWMAILVYFGILGFTTWMYILLKLRKHAYRLRNRIDQIPIVRQMSVAILILIIVTFAYTFVERTLVIRAYAFYFWAIAGLLSSFVYKQDQLSQATLDG